MDKITKFLQTLRKDERQMLFALFENVRILALDGYDISTLSGYKNTFRIRKGKFRIIFIKKEGIGYLLEVKYRKDAYRKF